MKKRDLISLVGRTPILRLPRLEEDYGILARVYMKLEKFNPTGSVKDRAAAFILRDGVERGLISQGGSVIEATSGNMGISLAALSSCFGCRAVIVMPDGMSVERRALISAYGGELVLTDGRLGMAGAMERAEQLMAEREGCYPTRQFTNPQSIAAHYRTTAAEICRDMGGRVDIIVAGVGTGGTLTGVGRYLKGRLPSVKVVAVEPSESAVISRHFYAASAGEQGSDGKMKTKPPADSQQATLGRENSSSHSIQGIGAGFLPPLLDMGLIDRVFTVSTEEARATVRKMAERYGVFLGISSGAAIFSAAEIGRLPENEGKNIVVILPDGGEKYLSLGV